MSQQEHTAKYEAAIQKLKPGERYCPNAIHEEKLYFIFKKDVSMYALMFSGALVVVMAFTLQPIPIIAMVFFGSLILSAGVLQGVASGSDSNKKRKRRGYLMHNVRKKWFSKAVTKHYSRKITRITSEHTIETPNFIKIGYDEKE